jgi:hypothetical protein
MSMTLDRSGAAPDVGGGDDALPFTDARIEATYRYWQSKAAGRAMPSRADIDPVEIPGLLPHIMLVDVLEDGGYRYRLIGTEIERAHGVKATGRRADEMIRDPDYRKHVLGLYAECLRERRPVFSEGLFLSPTALMPERYRKVLFLPLSQDGDRVNMLLLVVTFTHISEETRGRYFLDAVPYKELAHVLL